MHKSPRLGPNDVGVDEGASAVEYGLLVAAIAAAIAIVVFAVGGLVRQQYSDTCNVIQSKTNTSQNCNG